MICAGEEFPLDESVLLSRTTPTVCCCCCCCCDCPLCPWLDECDWCDEEWGVDCCISTFDLSSSSLNAGRRSIFSSVKLITIYYNLSQRMRPRNLESEGKQKSIFRVKFQSLCHRNAKDLTISLINVPSAFRLRTLHPYERLPKVVLSATMAAVYYPFPNRAYPFLWNTSTSTGWTPWVEPASFFLQG